MRFRVRCAFLSAWAFLCIPGATFAAPVRRSLRDAHTEFKKATTGNGAEITFRRVFKSSTPELIEIVVREDSDSASYEIRQLDDDPGSTVFTVSGPLRAKMF